MPIAMEPHTGYNLIFITQVILLRLSRKLHPTSILRQVRTLLVYYVKSEPYSLNLYCMSQMATPRTSP